MSKNTSREAEKLTTSPVAHSTTLMYKVKVINSMRTSTKLAYINRMHELYSANTTLLKPREHVELKRHYLSEATFKVFAG